MEVERARHLCGEVARASVGGRVWVGEEKEEQKGEERGGRQGGERKKGKNNICEGSNKRDRVKVWLCGGAS